MIQTAFSFDDLLMVPKYSNITSRSEVKLDNSLDKERTLTLPVISSPMDTVTEVDMAVTMSKHGGLGIIHRYNSIEHQAKLVWEAKNKGAKLVGAAVGSTGDFYERTCELVKCGVDIICVDVAHGHHQNVKEAIEKINKHSQRTSFHLMAGNVATGQAFQDLSDWGADSVRANVGGGSICSTRINTGFGVPTMSTIFDCVQTQAYKSGKTKLIIDGGIRYAGDMVKAFAAGAHFVMCGSMLAGTDESPGETFVDGNGVKMKNYRGMACYSSDTEILTENGWKTFDKLLLEEKVATLNKENNNIEYHVPRMNYSYDYNGDMISFKTNFVDLLVTPNHRMYFAKKSNKSLGYDRKYRFAEAEECIDQNIILKNSGVWSGRKVDTFTLPESHYSFPMNEWLEFFGFWLAEGCTYTYNQKNSTNYKVCNVSISNKDIGLVEKYVEMLNIAGIRAKTRIRERNELIYAEMVCCNKKLYNYLSIFGKAKDKYIPKEYKHLDKTSLESLLFGIYLGDGTKSCKMISTISTKLRDDIMEISLKCGGCPRFTTSHRSATAHGKFKHNHNLYTVYIGDWGAETFVSRNKISKKQYSGKVYCVEVQNNIVYVRRNGKPMWCGNSREAQTDWRGKSSAPEGISTFIKHKGSVNSILDDIRGNIQSGFSYAGARNFQELSGKVQFIQQTSAGAAESFTHILHKK